MQSGALGKRLTDRPTTDYVLSGQIFADHLDDHFGGREYVRTDSQRTVNLTHVVRQTDR